MGSPAAQVPSARTALLLPSAIRACLFDLDGVLTDTARIHAAAWQEMFDAYLHSRALATGTPFVPFDPVRDYKEYVDGRPRFDGVRSFLASRGIEAAAETVRNLAERKNGLVLTLIREGDVEAFPGSVRFVLAAVAAGLSCGVVSASANCADVLEAAGLAALLDVRVDGVVAARRGLRGKPAADTYLAAARLLDAEPALTAVFEDALAGVDAARAGGFGFVVGVDRGGQADSLRSHGADVVVADLAELLRE
jgi:beta-phosphoglucomutase family hydrolase